MVDFIQFHQILTTVIMVHMATATLVPTKFKKLDAGKSMMGKLGAELTTRSKLQCSDRCSSDIGCKAYRYKGKGEVNCLLVHANSTVGEGQLFEGDESHTLYEKESKEQTTPSTCPAPVSTLNGDIWAPLSGWSGPCPTLYRSFYSSESLVLMEGNNPMGDIPLVTGKTNLALSLDHTQSQWVDLGIHTEACMTRPETCGTAGGAISLWVNVECLGPSRGIISSKGRQSTGLSIYCSNNNIILLSVDISDGEFYVYPSAPTGWTHMVLNYIAPNNGQGISIYYNGAEISRDITKDIRSQLLSPGDSKIVVGRSLTNQNQNYMSVQVDELIYFNKALSREEISNMY